MPDGTRQAVSRFTSMPRSNRKFAHASLLLAGAGALGLACGVAWARDTPVAPPAAMAVVGTLTCGLSAENKAVDANPAAQGRDVLCRFQPGADGPVEVYVGTVQGVGKADVLFAKGAMILSVRAPAARAAPGMLQQSYSTDAAPKGAAPPLVGDRNKSIMLQPLHEQEGRVAKGELRPDALIVLMELRLRSSAA